MDTLTFVTKLIESLAWPIAALILVIVLRKEIRSLLPFIKRLKAGPVEAEFDRQLKQIKAEAGIIESQTMGFLTLPKQSTLIQLAEINPRSAIIEAWRAIELTTERVVSSRGLYVSPKQAESPSADIRAIIRANLLEEKDISLFYDLRALRNQAVHRLDFDATVESVLDYVRLAAQLQAVLEKLIEHQAG